MSTVERGYAQLDGSWAVAVRGEGGSVGLDGHALVSTRGVASVEFTLDGRKLMSAAA